MRSRLLKALAGLILAAILAYTQWERLWHFLTMPLLRQSAKVDLIATSPMESLMTSMKVSLIAGILLALPWITWQFWAFVGPAFLPRERRIFLPAFTGSIAMFTAGAAFCYYAVLPTGLGFLARYGGGTVTQNWRQGDYSSFICQFLLAFGLIFQLPVLAFVLARVGLVTARGLWKFARYAVIIIFVVAALLTPGPDPVSQLLMAAPLLLLYGLSIGIAALAHPGEAP